MRTVLIHGHWAVCRYFCRAANWVDRSVKPKCWLTDFATTCTCTCQHYYAIFMHSACVHVHMYMHTYALCGCTRHLRTCRYAAIAVNRPSVISQAAAIVVNCTQGVTQWIILSFESWEDWYHHQLSSRSEQTFNRAWNRCPSLKPMHNIGKVFVNASILYKNPEICNNTNLWKFQLISLFLLRKNSKNVFSIFVFILMAGVLVSRRKLIIGSYFTNYSKMITQQAEIFQGMLSTIVIFIPCKLCANLWTI